MDSGWPWAVGTATAACGCAQNGARACQVVQPTTHMHLRLGNRTCSGKPGEGLYSSCPSESRLGAYLSPHAVPCQLPRAGPRVEAPALRSGILHCTRRA